MHRAGTAECRRGQRSSPAAFTINITPHPPLQQTRVAPQRSRRIEGLRALISFRRAIIGSQPYKQPILSGRCKTPPPTPINMSSDRSRGSKGSKPGTTKSSPASALKRLTHEIQDLQETPNEAVLHLGPISDDDLFQWEAVLKGPRDQSSPYAGGLWLLTISIPSDYPLKPPKVTFITPICHPNVHFTTGEICLTLLGGEHWLPSYTIGSTMSAIQQLLGDPGNDSPLNVDIANLYRDRDEVGAEGLIRFWTGEKRWNGEGKGAWISERFPGSGGKLGG